MKFNIKSLEEKFVKISCESKKITKKFNNIENKKNIETIVFTFFTILNYEYNIMKKEYLEIISNLSPAYLIGSDWYIGEDYTFEYFYNKIDKSIKYKIYAFLFIMNLLYQKLD